MLLRVSKERLINVLNLFECGLERNYYTNAAFLSGFYKKNPLNIIFPFNLDIFLKATNNVKDKFPYKSSCLAIFREAGEVATLKLTEKG